MLILLHLRIINFIEKNNVGEASLEEFHRAT